MSIDQAPRHDQVQTTKTMWPSEPVTPNNGPTTEAPEPDLNISPQVQKDINELDGINQKQEERINKLEARALQLTNLYFVFQGVILSSISSAKPVKCHHWYVPFILSFIASLFNVVSLLGTLVKFLRYREELDQNREDISVMKQLRVTRAEVNEIDPGGQKYLINRQDGRQSITIERQKPDLYKQWMRRVVYYAGIFFFLGFSGVILHGCRALLCNSV